MPCEAWKRRLLVAAVVVQIAVPAMALMKSPPTRFGFQMYSGQGWTSVEVIGSSGDAIDVDIESYVAGALRPELDWTRNLPEVLCSSVRGAAWVTVTQLDRSRSLAC
jgi:hypothetical protein